MTVTPSLAEVIALSEKATAGPWTAHHGWANEDELDRAVTNQLHPNWVEVVSGYTPSYERMSLTGHAGIANAAFIAALVNWFRTSAASLRDEEDTETVLQPKDGDLIVGGMAYDD